MNNVIGLFGLHVVEGLEACGFEPWVGENRPSIFFLCFVK